MIPFRNKYKRESYRFKNWDYRNPGIYFITICTKDRAYHFGDCENGKVLWNESGEVASKFWKEIPMHFPHVKLDEYIVMPNHVHGILILVDMDVSNGVDNGDVLDDVGTLQCNVPTSSKTKNTQTKSLPPINNKMSVISPKSGSVSTIIRSYKSACTKHIRLQNPDINFQWQPRFYDRILWTQKDLEVVRSYILNNPKNWEYDSLRY